MQVFASNYEIAAPAVRARTRWRLRWSKLGFAFIAMAWVTGCAATPVDVASESAADVAAGKEGNSAESESAPVAVAPADDDKSTRYHVLVGELAAQRGMAATAAEHYVVASQYSSSRKLARRATQMALYADQQQLAFAGARRWAHLSPDSLDAQRAATGLALLQNEPAALRQASHALVAAAPSPAEGYQLLVDVLSGQAEHSELALATLRELAQADADSAHAWYALGLLASRYGELERGAEAAQRAIRLRPDWDQAALLQAAIHIQRQQPIQAQAVIEALPGSRKQRSAYHLSLARLLLEGHQPQAALGEFERAISLQPTSVPARYGLAILALNEGQLERAESAFKFLYETDSRPDEAAYYLGTIRERRQDYAAAEDWYRRVGSGGHAFVAQLSALRMQARRGDVGGARAGLQTLRSEYPHARDRLYDVEGQLLLRAQRPAAALAVYDEALAEDPDNINLLYSRSMACMELGRIDSATADLRTVLELDEDNIQAQNALGYLLTNHSNDYERALQLITRALEGDPGNPAILDSMGWVHFHLGNLTKALAYLERAYAGFPDPEIAAHMGEVLWQLDRRDEARAVWNEALRKHPEHKVLTETMARHGQ